jgi:hypothetical protein
LEEKLYRTQRKNPSPGDCCERNRGGRGVSDHGDGQTVIAQNSSPSTQEQMQQPGNQKTASESDGLVGTTAKAGNEFVLSD